METYKAEFIGREVGAIGIFYPIVEFVQANEAKEVRMKLYEKYEHIQKLKVALAKS